MNRHWLSISICSGFLVVGLVSCGVSSATNSSGAQAQATSARAAQATAPLPNIAVPTTTTISSTLDLGSGVSGIGEVKAAQDANLSLAAQGTVAQVFAKEGDVVKQGQMLAILDTRTLDQQINQAQAALDIALANQAALTEPPSPADVRAERAQVRQAQIALAQTQVSQPQTIQDVQATVAQAQASLQTQRDALSQAKTQAEQQVQQAALALEKAQATYAQAKSDWDYVQQTGRSPANPSTANPLTGKKQPNKVNDSQREQYYAAYVQAEASMQQAEVAVQQALVVADQARKAEVTGIQAAEPQVAQAQTNLNKLQLPKNADQVAAAQAGLDQAQANLAKLYPNPTKSDIAKAEANMRQSHAALDAAKVARENAAIRAPFDGVIAQINIDPGDPSAIQGAAPIYIIDTSALHVDVPISDVNIGQLRVGQAAQMYADAAPGKVYTGTVSYIAPAATTSGNVRTYVVRLTLKQQEDLRPGMSIRVEFDAGKDH